MVKATSAKTKLPLATRQVRICSGTAARTSALNARREPLLVRRQSPSLRSRLNISPLSLSRLKLLGLELSFAAKPRVAVSKRDVFVFVFAGVRRAPVNITHPCVPAIQRLCRNGGQGCHMTHVPSPVFSWSWSASLFVRVRCDEHIPGSDAQPAEMDRKRVLDNSTVPGAETVGSRESQVGLQVQWLWMDDTSESTTLRVALAPARETCCRPTTAILQPTEHCRNHC